MLLHAASAYLVQEPGNACMASSQPPIPKFDAPLSNWSAEAGRQFLAIAQLPPGWDSQGGDPPDAETVQAGANLLTALADAEPHLAKPHIHPTRSGGVQFHWESGPRYLEVEILDPCRAQFYFLDREARRECEGTVQMQESVAELLRLVRMVGGVS